MEDRYAKREVVTRIWTFFYLYLILVAMIVIVPVAICDVVFDLHLLK